MPTLRTANTTRKRQTQALKRSSPFALPIKILQFGQGNFMRSFFDWQIDLLNERSGLNAGVVVVRPRGGSADKPGAPLLDVRAARVLAPALRRAASLASLTLQATALWDDGGAAAAIVFAALTARAQPCALDIKEPARTKAQRADAGATLAGLLRADSRAVRELRVASCRLGDVGMAPLLLALSRNTRLRALDVSGNDMTANFSRTALLRALRANTGLREFELDDTCAGSREAAALVLARA